MSEKIDRFGMVASSLCAIHCAASAMIPALFSALGLGLLLSHETEWVFTLIAIAIATSAAVISWRQTRSIIILTLFAVGILGLLGSRVIEMGSDHHGVHEHHTQHQEQHGEKGHADQTAAHHHKTHSDDAQANSNAIEDSAHGQGATSPQESHESAVIWGVITSILSGFFLLLGHILNIRLSRQKQEECCS